MFDVAPSQQDPGEQEFLILMDYFGLPRVADPGEDVPLDVGDASSSMQLAVQIFSGQVGNRLLRRHIRQMLDDVRTDRKAKPETRAIAAQFLRRWN